MSMYKMHTTRLQKNNTTTDFLYYHLLNNEASMKVVELSYSLSNNCLTIECYYDLDISSKKPFFINALYSVKELEVVVKVEYNIEKDELSMVLRVDLVDKGCIYESVEVAQDCLDIVGGIDTTLSSLISNYVVKEFTSARSLIIEKSLDYNSEGKELKIEDIVNYCKSKGDEIASKGDKEGKMSSNLREKMAKRGVSFPMTLDLRKNDFSEFPCHGRNHMSHPCLVDSKAGLYVSSEDCARRALDYGITCVINCLDQSPPSTYENKVDYLSLKMRDHCDQDLILPIEVALKKIHDNVGKGVKTLVHCQAGISRSTSLCIAWLMYSRKVSFREAFAHVRHHHERTDPNLGFILALEGNEKGIQCLFNSEIHQGFKMDNDLHMDEDCVHPLGFSPVGLVASKVAGAVSGGLPMPSSSTSPVSPSVSPFPSPSVSRKAFTVPISPSSKGCTKETKGRVGRKERPSLSIPIKPRTGVPVVLISSRASSSPVSGSRVVFPDQPPKKVNLRAEMTLPPARPIGWVPRTFETPQTPCGEGYHAEPLYGPPSSVQSESHHPHHSYPQENLPGTPSHSNKEDMDKKDEKDGGKGDGMKE